MKHFCYVEVWMVNLCCFCCVLLSSDDHTRPSVPVYSVRRRLTFPRQKVRGCLMFYVITLHASCSAVYCNRHVYVFVCVCVCGSVTTITRKILCALILTKLGL